MSRPYTEKEKMLVVSLVRQYSRIIENKKSNSTTWLAKQEAWRTVARRFNSNPVINIRRNEKQLKKLWENLKQREKNAQKCKRLLIKEDPLEITAVDSIFNTTNAVVPHVQTENTYDVKLTEEPLCVTKRGKFVNTRNNKPKKSDLQLEKELRLQKLREGIEQQRELHLLKMEICKTELKYVQSKLEFEQKRLKTKI